MTVFYKTIVITDEEELFNLWEEWERVRSFVRRPSECDRSVTHAGCCSEGCEYRCCDARYELHDPLEGFLLSHSLPPSLYRLLHVAVATGIAASALLFFFFDILPSPFCWLHDVC